MNQPVKLTKTNVRAALKRALKKRGKDFRYSDEFGKNCRYVVKGQPACLVGEVLVDLGVDPAVFRKIQPNRYGVRQGLNVASLYSIEPVLMRLGVLDAKSNPDALRSLAEAQSYQDGGDTWGTAVLEAERVLSK